MDVKLVSFSDNLQMLSLKPVHLQLLNDVFSVLLVFDNRQACLLKSTTLWDLEMERFHFVSLLNKLVAPPLSDWVALCAYIIRTSALGNLPRALHLR